MAGGDEIGVVDGHVVRLAIESLKQFWVGFEFFGSTLELAGVADKDTEPTVQRSQDASDFNIAVAKFAKVADFVAIFAEAHEDEATFRVGGFGGADVEEAGAVVKFDDLIDVGADAGVVIGLGRVDLRSIGGG